MAEILILTKNSLAEQPLQNTLQRLNDEVYCSSRLFFEIDRCSDLFSFFSLVILSDSISTIEISHYWSSLKKSKLPIIRKGNKALVRQSDYDWMIEEIDDWIEDQMSVAEIVDMVTKYTIKPKETVTSKGGSSTDPSPYSDVSYYQFVSSLSSKEQQFLLRMYEAQGETVSREQLCERLWNREPTNSSLCQLSTIVHRLKNKLSLVGLNEQDIKTLWGKGYFIEPTLHSFLEKYEFH
ncbi:winged helix-turn-helix domain-containing protein [Enterococcus sp. AZ196]|uniref:winged helix-turn-helix domain-containing protein n=1 Tax=Enterococcus sp. AZ196 TaxID=2774659 RepID=UPI003D2E000E